MTQQTACKFPLVETWERKVSQAPLTVFLSYTTIKYNMSPAAWSKRMRRVKKIFIRVQREYFLLALPYFHSTYHLTCRPSGGSDCCSSVFPRRSSSSSAEFPGLEPEETAWEWWGGSGFRRRLGAAWTSASMLSEDCKETARINQALWKGSVGFRRSK